MSDRQTILQLQGKVFCLQLEKKEKYNDKINQNNLVKLWQFSEHFRFEIYNID